MSAARATVYLSKSGLHQRSDSCELTARRNLYVRCYHRAMDDGFNPTLGRVVMIVERDRK